MVVCGCCLLGEAIGIGQGTGLKLMMRMMEGPLRRWFRYVEETNTMYIVLAGFVN